MGSISVQLIKPVLGSDLDVVNAARVSFDKESEWEVYAYESEPDLDSRSYHVYDVKRLSDRDTKLINFLAREGHWSPFSHCFARFRIAAPIFVARQLQKHTVGLAWNEVSRRYVDAEPSFFVPETWRRRAENVKQGSSSEAVDSYEVMKALFVNTWYDEPQNTNGVGYGFFNVQELALEAYKKMLDAGVCPEQARMVLPQSMMTEWWWSGSLYAFARVCNLRLDSHAQKETQEVAQGISNALKEQFPVSWKALVPNG